MPVPPSPVTTSRTALFDPDQTTPTDGADRHFSLALLDGFRLERQGRTVSVPQAVSRIVAFLGVRGRASRAELAGNLWPEVSDARAHASLRTALWRLRQVSADHLVVGNQVLCLASSIEVDVVVFIDVMRRFLAPAPTADAHCVVEQVTRTGLIAAGELLPGWYEDWVLFERERLRQLQMHALEAAAIKLMAIRRYAEAIEAALAAVRLEPLRESATRVLIMAHLAEHNIVEAVRCFEGFRASLMRELGVPPTPDLERMALCGFAVAEP